MINKALILNVEQGSEEWLKARLGVITASEFNKIITPKGSKSSSSGEYMGKLIAEHVTNEQQDTYYNDAMARGNELEPKARILFEQIKKVDVETVGMVFKDNDKNIACSPDGLINYKTGLEIKCPTLAKHISYVLDNNIPKIYIAQVQGSMWVTGAKGWWFMSYHPNYKPLIIFIKRDDAYIAKMEQIILSFSELLQIYKDGGGDLDLS